MINVRAQGWARLKYLFRDDEGNLKLTRDVRKVILLQVFDDGLRVQYFWENVIIRLNGRNLFPKYVGFFFSFLSGLLTFASQHRDDRGA